MLRRLIGGTSGRGISNLALSLFRAWPVAPLLVAGQAKGNYENKIRYISVSNLYR